MPTLIANQNVSSSVDFKSNKPDLTNNINAMPSLIRNSSSITNTKAKISIK